jgi:hypothetical protein
MDMAARRPDRAASLVLVNARARWMWAEDYRFGVTPDVASVTLRRVVDPDADRQSLPQPAPSVPPDDTAFWKWWERAGHRRASPAMASAVMEQRLQFDMRPALSRIQCPTLVVQRTNVDVGAGPPGTSNVEHGRYIADHIPNARLVELPGRDMIWWVGDADAVVDEIELFVTQGAAKATKRALATVLFVDVVGSTQRAVSMGDKRWRELLETYNDVVSSAVGRFGGRLVGTEGDGALGRESSSRTAVSTT